MIKKLSPFYIHKAVKTVVEKNTSCKCYDEVPAGKKSPFYYVELVSTKPDNTKTMWSDTYEVWIHAVGEAKKGSTQIYEMINNLDEALTEEIPLPEDYELIDQRSDGLQVLKTDETNEKHAIVAYKFKVCYGFRCK